ncbi:MAG: glycoside hydrolase [Acetobacteraceae bacterium]|nr:glycoside hydrolase [Acetobacteraceae bacterium]
MIRRAFSLVVVVMVLAALVVMAWWLPNRDAAGVAGLAATQLNSVSFAPFRSGQSPLANRFPSAAEVDADLALLAPITRAIRTYATIEGDYDVPALAARHGIKIWLGLWLGGDRAQNAREIVKAIMLANAYPDTVERVIVGNEVLLRRDLPVDALIAAIDEVRGSVRQPVTYADVWEFWEQFPQLAQHVDIVTIHLLPYWEDVPTGIDDAVAHVVATYRRVATRFPGQKIAIGETGWPSAGRTRREAVPSRVNQVRLIAAFVAAAQSEGFDYNLIEAFDQSWKYKNEGTVGAAWGIFHADRTGKFPAGIRVVNDPDWATHAGFSVLCGLLLLMMGLWGPGLGGQSLTAGGQARIAILAMVLGGAVVFAHVGTWTRALDHYLLAAYAVNMPAQAWLALLLIRHAGMRWAGTRWAGAPAPPARSFAQATETVRSLLRLRPYLPADPAGRLDDLFFVFVWTAMVLQLLLIFDPRYRDFPLPVFAVPLVCVLARAAFGEHRRGGGGREEFCVGATLAAAALASAVIEGSENMASVVWNTAALILAAPALLRLLPVRAKT